MRRTPVFATAGSAAIAAIALGFVPWTLPAERASGATAAELTNSAGLSLRNSGAATLRLLPRPSLDLGHAELRFADGAAALTARKLTAGLRLSPLLLGRFEAASLRFEGMTLRAATAEAHDSWRDVARRMMAARSPGGDRAAAAAPERIEFADSVAVIGDEGSAHVFTEIAGAVTWAGADAGVAAALAGRLRGQAVRASLTGYSPGLMRAGKTPVAFRFDSPLLTIATQGEVTTASDGHVNGRFTLESPALAEVAAWLDIAVPLSAVAPAVTIRGAGLAGFGGFDLAQAEVLVGKDQFEGTLALRLGEGPPQLSGTLAATTLDLSHVATIAARLLAGDDEPIATRLLREADLDLRLSANRATLRDLRFDDVGLSAVLKRGRLEMTLGRAQIGGGAFRARVTALASGRGLELKSNGSLASVDAAAAWKPGATAFTLAGLANAEYVLDAAGRTSRELVASLLGSIDLRLENGEIGGFDAVALARLWHEKPDAEAPPPKGRTPFATARFGATLWNGVAEVKTAEVRSPQMRATAFGRISLLEAEIDLTGSLALEGGPPSRAAPSFRLSGPWGQPAFSASSPPP